MTDCKSPLGIIISHDYCFGDLREELESGRTENFHIEIKARKPKVMQHIRNRRTDRKSGAL